MDVEKFEGGWSDEEELEMIIQRFANSRDGLLEIGKTLEIDWFTDRERLPYSEKEKAASKMMEHVKEQEKEEQLLELEKGLNALSEPSRSSFECFWGQHFVVKRGDDGFEVEEGPAEEMHEEVKGKVKRVTKGSERIGPFLRGILTGGSSRSDKIYTDWSDARAAGTLFYEGEASFQPSREASLPGEIPGVSTTKTNSGRSYRVARELAPVIWEVLEESGDEGPVKTPEMEVPEKIGRRVPKFEEMLDSVELTDEDIEEFEEILEKNDALDYWADYVAPDVKFRDVAKEAVLCMLASPEDKHGNKGRTNAIFYGPPGTGKTAFKNFLTEKLGAYSIDGSRVSKADLTYNKRTDEDGLLVRAHKGLAVIEEADKMDSDAMGAALTALGETGRVEIRDKILPAEVRGVMLGNYESREEIIDKHGEALFNRFEFVMNFEKLDDDELDETLNWHYKFYRKPKPKEDASWLKKYLKWVRDFEPGVPEEELEKIREFKSEKLDQLENVREGISVMSVAWTLARLNHRDVTLEDYKKAFRLVGAE